MSFNNIIICTHQYPPKHRSIVLYSATSTPYTKPSIHSLSSNSSMDIFNKAAKALNPVKYASVYNDTKHEVRLQWQAGFEIVRVSPGQKKQVESLAGTAITINLVDAEANDDSTEKKIWANDFQSQEYKMSFLFKNKVAAIKARKAAAEKAKAKEVADREEAERVAAAKEAEKKANSGWAIMQKKKRIYSQETESTDIDFAVDKIAQAVTGTVATVASGGALSPLLAAKLKDFVVNAGWSSSTEESSAEEHMFWGNDEWLFVQIKKRVSKSSWWMIFSRNKVSIQAEGRILYMKAGDDKTRAVLREMAQKQALDAMDYVDSLPGWAEEEE